MKGMKYILWQIYIDEIFRVHHLRQHDSSA